MPTVTVRPTSFVDSGEGGTLAWVNPSNAGASDNAYATVSASVSGFSLGRWLHCTVSAPVLSIPVDATNIAIILQIEGHASDFQLVGYEALMLLDGVREVDFASVGYVPTSDQLLMSPPVSDARITPAKLNNPANGIALQFNFGGFSGLDGLSTVIGSLDDMQITIAYDSATAVSVLTGQWDDVTEASIDRTTSEVGIQK